ncbi:MAG: lipopolysaccharide assembly protein LapA domain-containing protein [Gammaproteobacteria bacterium]|nr:lipopolysaccharide assembly protein LapA domain-containing protein [Gammaproteobacteria bacterium]
MKTFGRLLFYLVLVGVLLFWTVFTVYNPDPLSLKLLNWQSMSLPISVWLLGAFTLGGIGGILLCAGGYFKGKAAQKDLKLELERQQVEEEESRDRSNALQSTRTRPMSVANPPSTDVSAASEKD